MCSLCHGGRADGQGRSRGLPQGHRAQAQGQRTADHLGRAQPEHQPAHQAQPLPGQLQPDQEQQDHHPELGEPHHIVLLAHQVQGEGPDDHALQGADRGYGYGRAARGQEGLDGKRAAPGRGSKAPSGS